MEEDQDAIIEGMKEIIREHKSSIDMRKEELDDLLKEIDFCRKHKFGIEANEKSKRYRAMSEVYYSFRKLLSDMIEYTGYEI